MQEEIWKDVLGYEGRYKISNTGKVLTVPHTITYSFKDGRVRTKTIHAAERKVQRSYNGLYKSIYLGSGNNFFIHRLVAFAFLPNPDNLEFVNHKDGDKHNNCVENLEWCTRQQNEDHAFRTGLKNSTGEHNTMSKLKDDQVYEIKYSKVKNTETSKYFAKHFNVHRATIQRIWCGVIWKHI